MCLMPEPYTFPPFTLYTFIHCTHCALCSVLIHTGKGGKVRGATAHKAGSKISTRLTVQISLDDDISFREK
jgi:hypothetical protein